MGLGGVDKECANVGFLDGSESTKGGEFFDADFAFAGFAEAGSVEDFEIAAMVFNIDTINVTRGSLTGANDGLLFFAKGVK